MDGSMWNSSFLFLLFGILGLIASAALKEYAKQQERFRNFTEGIVVNIVAEPAEEEENRTEFRNRHYAEIEYFAEGKLVKVKSPEAVYPSPYEVGQKLTVCYDSRKPSRYYIWHPNKWNYGSTAARILAMVLILIGIVYFFLSVAP